GPVADVDAARAVGRGGEAAIEHRHATGDLVLERVVEQANAGAETVGGSVLGAELGGGRGFRLQVRGADQRNPALAAEAVDARGQLLDARGTVDMADAGLEHPAHGSIPNHVAV